MLLPKHLRSSWSKFGHRLERDKRLIAIEVLLISGAVIGWVFLPVPRTIVPFFVLASASLWMRGLSWRDVGLDRPSKAWTTFLAGTAVAAAAAIAGQTVVLPALSRATGEPSAVETYQAMRGNIAAWLAMLAVVWVLAALMEEMVFRGYFLNRLASLFGHSRTGWLIGLLGSSMLFVVAHGPSSSRVIATTLLMGLLEGSAYLGWKRNLWMPIIIHGMADTISLTVVYLGMN